MTSPHQLSHNKGWRWIRLQWKLIIKLIILLVIFISINRQWPVCFFLNERNPVQHWVLPVWYNPHTISLARSLCAARVSNVVSFWKPTKCSIYLLLLLLLLLQLLTSFLIAALRVQNALRAQKVAFVCVVPQGGVVPANIDESHHVFSTYKDCLK